MVLSIMMLSLLPYCLFQIYHVHACEGYKKKYIYICLTKYCGSWLVKIMRFSLNDCFFFHLNICQCLLLFILNGTPTGMKYGI